MLSALSVAEFWRNEAAFLAASRRLRASCRCFSAELKEELDEESALFSRPSGGRTLPGFFDAAFSSSCRVGSDRKWQRGKSKEEIRGEKDRYHPVRKCNQETSRSFISLDRFSKQDFDETLQQG